MARTNELGLVTLKDSDLMLAHAEDDVRGLSVVDAEGAPVGEVDDLVVDEEERRARFLVVTAGGFLGLGKAKRLVPVDTVTDVDDVVHVERSSGEVHALEFDPSSSRGPTWRACIGPTDTRPLPGPATSRPAQGSSDGHEPSLRMWPPRVG